MEDVKRILVLSRSTTDCKKAVHYGISLARTYGAQLSISTSCTILSSSGVAWVYVPILKTMEEEYQAMMEEVKVELVEMVQKEKAQGMAIKEMVKDAEPVHENREDRGDGEHRSAHYGRP